jgi:hypothetical protein
MTDRISVVPVRLAQANEFVARHHRHHKPVPGSLFAIGVQDEGGQLRGVAIVGRPVARMLDDGVSAEIVRTCTDGTRNACSMLLGAARRAARAMGYRRILTYTLPEEGGASLRAAGFVFDGEAGDASKRWHSREGRNAQPIGNDMFGGKWRWIAIAGEST